MQPRSLMPLEQFANLLARAMVQSADGETVPLVVVDHTVARHAGDNIALRALAPDGTVTARTRINISDDLAQGIHAYSGGELPPNMRPLLAALVPQLTSFPGLDGLTAQGVAQALRPCVRTDREVVIGARVQLRFSEPRTFAFELVDWSGKNTADSFRVSPRIAAELRERAPGDALSGNTSARLSGIITELMSHRVSGGYPFREIVTVPAGLGAAIAGS